MSSETRSNDHPGSPDHFAHVRYQVADVARSIAFYTQRLGFAEQAHVGKAFGSVSLGKLRLILGGPLIADPDGNPIELHEAPPR